MYKGLSLRIGKVILMMKTKTIAKGKCFGSPARQRDSLVFNIFLCEKRHFLSQENVRPGYVAHLGNFQTFLREVLGPHLIFLKLIHTKLDYIGYLWVPS